MAPQTKVYGHQSLIILWAFVKPSSPVQIWNSLYYKMCLNWACVGGGGMSVQSENVLMQTWCQCQRTEKGEGGGHENVGVIWLDAFWINIFSFFSYWGGILEGVYAAHDMMIEICFFLRDRANLTGLLLLRLSWKQMKEMCGFYFL